MFNKIQHQIIQCIALLVVVNLCLVSCASNISQDAGRFSAVSLSDQTFKPQEGEQFAWYTDIFVNDVKSEIKVNEQSKRHISDLISKSISDSGYQVINNILGADYLISAMVVLGNDNNQQVAPYFKAFPQIAKSVNDYENGTLLITISRHSGKYAKLMWEGAIQAYILGEELTEEQKAIRLEQIVKRLMEALPRSNTNK